MNTTNSLARIVALNDAVLGGWYAEEQELFEGFSISAADTVLDVGCGEGHNAYYSAMQGAHVIFADINEDNLRATERRVAKTRARKITPLLTDSNPLPLDDGVASKVIATEVLEHVDDPVQLLHELARVGRPGAQYLFAVPDPVAEELQKPFAPSGHFQKPNHIRIIQREEFAKMITDAGLQIQRRTSYGFYCALWWILFWIRNPDSPAPQVSVLNKWTETWQEVLSTPQGRELKKALDTLLPKSQVIIAQKPISEVVPLS